MTSILHGVIFVKTIPRPKTKTHKTSQFTIMQELTRKGVERALMCFIRGLPLFVALLSIGNLRKIMTCCIILHNIRIEEESDMGEENSRYICPMVILLSHNMMQTWLRDSLKRTSRRIPECILTWRWSCWASLINPQHFIVELFTLFEPWNLFGVE
jgi:hypothetical protein